MIPLEEDQNPPIKLELVPLAEWSVNPEILVEHLNSATNLILDLNKIVAEYLHAPDPNAKYVFGPKIWIDYFNDNSERCPMGNFLLSTFNTHHKIEEAKFFTGHEEGDEKLKKTMPTKEQEAILQTEDPLNPGKKIEENALRLFNPSHIFGKNLTNYQSAVLVGNVVNYIAHKMKIPYIFVDSVCSSTGREIADYSKNRNGNKYVSNSRWIVLPIRKDPELEEDTSIVFRTARG